MVKKRIVYQQEDPPWTPFVEVQLTDADREMLSSSVRGMYELPTHVLRNSRYQVLVTYYTPGSMMLVEEADLEYVIHLSIKRLDLRAIRDWRELQRIKNEIVGPETEAVEVFPMESRLVDTSNQFHLWVMPPGFAFPFGYQSRAVVNSCDFPGQRPFEDPPKDVVDREEVDKAVAGITGSMHGRR